MSNEGKADLTGRLPSNDPDGSNLHLNVEPAGQRPCTSASGRARSRRRCHFLCSRWQREADASVHGAARSAHERRGGSADGAALTFTPPLLRLSIKFSLLISAEAPSPLPRVLAPRSLTRDFPLHSLVFIGVVLVPRFSRGGGGLLRKTYCVHYMGMFPAVRYSRS